MTIQQALDLALQHHQAGQLAEAEALYRQILAAEPRHADALHLLGVIAHQVGRNDIAVDLIRQAIALAPDVPSFHSNLGNALRDRAQLDEAIAAFGQAIALNPHLPETHGNLGTALLHKGQLDEAIASIRQAIALNPQYAEAHSNLGNAFYGKGRLDEAIAAYRQAIVLEPRSPEARYNLGNALQDKGHLDEAITAYRQAIALNPHLPEAHNNLGTALLHKGLVDEAITSLRQAIALKPDYPEAHSNLGTALKDQGQLDEAIAACRRAVALKPSLPEAHSNLGNALREKGHLDEAIAAYRHAVTLNPRLPEAHNNLGNALRENRQLDEAIVATRQAIALKPNYPAAHSNLGTALKDQGQLDEAIAAYRQAIALKPGFPEAQSNLLLTLHYHCHVDARAITEEHDRWNRQFCGPMIDSVRPFANDRNPERLLRVGYVSNDLRDQVVGRNVRPLFRNHDHREFQVFCYAGVAHPDWLTAEFREGAERWRNTMGVKDEKLAEMIREDGVDILVDLAQHTAGNRLRMFAGQPAPVQVSFAGYPASAGVNAIRYRISDRYLEAEAAASEMRGEQWELQPERLFLIDSFWCYDPCGMDLPPNALPAQANGHLTFGSLNNFCKTNEPVLNLWARVLGAVKDSRLVLLSARGSHRQRVIDLLARAGVEAKRVDFVEPGPRRAHLESYRRLDIVLDPFPYNGHTTSLDALWMGVPVVSLAGERPVSRAGLSQLSNLGLRELVAETEDDYLKIAVRLAGDLPRLAELRRTLRPRMEQSPLMDAPRFARSIEAAYRAMWRHWCMKKKPALL